MNHTILLMLILQLLVPMLTSSRGRYQKRKLPLINNGCIYKHNICNETQLDRGQQEDVKKILDRHPILDSFFTNKTVYETLEKAPDGSDRSGGSPDEYQSVCWTDDVTFVPSSVFTVDSKFMYIVNQDNRKQIVRGKICRKSKHKSYCTTLSGFGTYRHAKCVQRWSTITMLGIDQDTGKPEYVRVSIPSDCVCTVRNKED